MRCGVFLDRDGTLNEEAGYINHIDRFRVYPWAAPAILKLNQAKLAAVLVTNQSGVARGYFPESLVVETHSRLTAELERFQARLDGIYYCPHHPEGKIAGYRKACNCRKPAPGMLQRAAADLDLDLRTSFIISDRYQDISMGLKVGLRGILVQTGYGKGECQYHKDAWPVPPDFIAENVLQAVDWILGQAAAGLSAHAVSLDME